MNLLFININYLIKKLMIVLIFLLFVITSEKSNVYFTKEISPKKIVEMFKKLNVELKGNVALKVHTGEQGGPYFLRPDFLQDIYDYTNGTFVECNCAYRAYRHSTELHKQTLEINGWLKNGRRTIIMDENPEKNFNLSILNHKMISENIVGEHLKNFDSCLVIAHFKGHGIGGFGGALKQLSIGFASQAGKTYIHTAGVTTNWTELFVKIANQENFTASMADAASSIVNYFKKKGNIVFINVLANISLSCDCAGASAPKPKIHDMGILASTDPVAIDKVCIDMIRNYTDNGTEEWLKQSDNKLGENTIKVAEELGIGTQDYNFINVDDEKKSSYLWLYIILVIIGLILVGIVGIFIYLKINRRKDDELIAKIINGKNI